MLFISIGLPEFILLLEEVVVEEVLRCSVLDELLKGDFSSINESTVSRSFLPGLSLSISVVIIIRE